MHSRAPQTSKKKYLQICLCQSLFLPQVKAHTVTDAQLHFVSSPFIYLVFRARAERPTSTSKIAGIRQFLPATKPLRSTVHALQWSARSANSKLVPCGTSRQTVLGQISMQTARPTTVSPSNHVYDSSRWPLEGWRRRRWKISYGIL